MSDEETIFAAASEKASASARAAFLDRVCAGRDELRARVEVLLAAHEGAGSFLELPPSADLTVDISGAMQPKAGTVVGPPQTGNYVSKTLHDLQRFLQLRVNPNAEGFCRVFDGDVRLHALALYAFSLPGIPASDWNTQDIAAD